VSARVCYALPHRLRETLPQEAQAEVLGWLREWLDIGAGIGVENGRLVVFVSDIRDNGPEIMVDLEALFDGLRGDEWDEFDEYEAVAKTLDRCAKRVRAAGRKAAGRKKQRGAP
jgi:hypothetical protein